MLFVRTCSGYVPREDSTDPTTPARSAPAQPRLATMASLGSRLAPRRTSERSRRPPHSPNASPNMLHLLAFVHQIGSNLVYSGMDRFDSLCSRCKSDINPHLLSLLAPLAINRVCHVHILNQDGKVLVLHDLRPV